MKRIIIIAVFGLLVFSSCLPDITTGKTPLILNVEVFPGFKSYTVVKFADSTIVTFGNFPILKSNKSYAANFRNGVFFEIVDERGSEYRVR